MAEKSRAPDGDRQADGWGAAWLDREGTWRTIKSIAPIWTEREKFKDLPETRILAVHARSASFPDQKGVLEYIQPFAEGHFAFVFNGLLKGVSLPGQNGSGVGSQKIWNLFLGFLKTASPSEALNRLVGLLEKRTKEICVLNIGLCDGAHLYGYSQYTDHPGYYHLHALESPGLKALCSESLPGGEFKPVRTHKALVL